MAYIEANKKNVDQCRRLQQKSTMGDARTATLMPHNEATDEKPETAAVESN